MLRLFFIIFFSLLDVKTSKREKKFIKKKKKKKKKKEKRQCLVPPEGGGLGFFAIFYKWMCTSPDYENLTFTIHYLSVYHFAHKKRENKQKTNNNNFAEIGCFLH